MAEFRVVPVPREALEKLTGLTVHMPVSAYVGVEGNHIVGAGGLGWHEGRCWLFLQIFDDVPRGMTIYRWGRRMQRLAAQLGETEIFTPRDVSYETSERLLRRLGFAFHETDNGEEIWRCPV